MAGGACIPARVLDAHTRTRVLRAPRAAGQLHSVFARTANLLWHDGRLVALHGPHPLRAPFAIALEAWEIGEPDPGAAVEVDGPRLHLGGVVIDLEPAAVVDLALRPVEHGPAALLLALAAVPPPPVAPGLSGPAGATAQDRLREGIRRRDPAVLLEGAGGLVGLGEGLTPAGDDCLVGALAALHAFAAPWLAEEPGIGAGIQTAAAGTTRIAREFLLSAVEGRFAAALVRLCGGAPREAAAAVADLLQVGGTSGADTLRGVTLALEALVQAAPAARAAPQRWRYRT